MLNVTSVKMMITLVWEDGLCGVAFTVALFGNIFDEGAIV